MLDLRYLYSIGRIAWDYKRTIKYILYTIYYMLHAVCGHFFFVNAALRSWNMKCEVYRIMVLKIEGDMNKGRFESVNLIQMRVEGWGLRIPIVHSIALSIHPPNPSWDGLCVFDVSSPRCEISNVRNSAAMNNIMELKVTLDFLYVIA